MDFPLPAQAMPDVAAYDRMYSSSHRKKWRRSAGVARVQPAERQQGQCVIFERRRRRENWEEAWKAWEEEGGGERGRRRRTKEEAEKEERELGGACKGKGRSSSEVEREG